MAIVKGRNLKVKRGGVQIACSRSCELSIDADMKEIANPSDSNWKKYRSGRKAWQITVSGLVPVSGGVKSEADLVGTSATLSFENAENQNDDLSGTAICKSAKITGTLGNLVQYSCVFIGTGALS